MADKSDFTYVLFNEFVPFLDELRYKELRQTLFTVEFEVADRMINLSEGVCSELVFFLRIFESQYNDTGSEITEVIEQVLSLKGVEHACIGLRKGVKLTASDMNRN